MTDTNAADVAVDETPDDTEAEVEVVERPFREQLSQLVSEYYKAERTDESLGDFVRFLTDPAKS